MTRPAAKSAVAAAVSVLSAQHAPHATTTPGRRWDEFDGSQAGLYLFLFGLIMVGAAYLFFSLRTRTMGSAGPPRVALPRDDGREEERLLDSYAQADDVHEL